MTQGFGPCCFDATVGSNPTASSNLIWPSGGMVYAQDLKSCEIFLVWVQVPPRLPNLKKGI